MRRHGRGKQVEASTEEQRSTYDGPSSICWICLDEDTCDMVSPCHCRGSMARIHEECLSQWIQRQAADHRAKLPSCPHCGAVYDILEETDVSSDRFFANPLAELRTLIKLANELADDEDWGLLIAAYAQRALVFLPLCCVMFLGLLLILRVCLSVYFVGPSPLIAQDDVISIWAASNPVSVLIMLVTEPIGSWCSHPGSLRQDPPEQSADKVSVAWFQVVAALQRASEFRIFSLCVALFIRENLPTVGKDSLEASRMGFKLLPVAGHVIRSILARLVYFGWFCRISPAIHSMLEVLVWQVLASYAIVSVELVAHAISIWRLSVDFAVAVEEDISSLQSAQSLRAGRFRLRSCDGRGSRDSTGFRA